MSIELAKTLRANPTEAEKRFWRLLFPFRTGGFHFRKQAQVGNYYVDFVCHHARLIIEVDGDQHGTANGISRDEVRDRYLNDRGYRVLRFGNRDVLTNPEGVFRAVAEALGGAQETSSVPPTPSPALPARGRVSERSGFGQEEKKS
ncbi:MAG: endonuclease domain-containing protein [Devosia sp.]|nr:endonuclease domain-containing protein [Devosia sp.]